MDINLSRLKKVDLREAWQHEAYDFTNWLSELEVFSFYKKTFSLINEYILYRKI